MDPLAVPKTLTTDSQFLAQVARAKLLEHDTAAMQNPSAAEAVAHILQSAKDLNLPLWGPSRFPVRVDLPTYADALSKTQAIGDGLSILRHVAQRLTRDLDTAIEVDSLRRWLSQYPWLVIFDGLDEVPPSANRNEVINAIDSFWDEVHEQNADVLVIVTTRPQGYNHDLNPRIWEHWELSPLESDDAIQFAVKLAEVRLSDGDRRQAIIADLHEACIDPATQLLTTTPLQIAILFGIAFLKGSIPQDRWELFDRYYSLLRDREAQKPGQAGSFLRDHKRTVNALHQTCGFVLQVAAEASGGSGAFLTEAQFNTLITNLLLEEGYSEVDASKLAGNFRRIATERLVLLASRVEGRISFDVRSLQEYMAAALIAAAESGIIDARLRAIAASAHWRHVFRIAASKVFSVSDLGHLRRVLLGILDALNKGDVGDTIRATRVGSSLAVDLLRDGVSTGAPLYRRQLAARALEALDAWPTDRLDDLLGIVASDTEEVVRTELLSRIKEGSTSRAQSAWWLLLQLSSGRQWASELALENWPSDADMLLSVARNCDLARIDPLVRQKLLESQLSAGPTAAARFALTFQPDFRFGRDFPDGPFAVPLDLLHDPRVRRQLSATFRVLGVGECEVNSIDASKRKRGVVQTEKSLDSPLTSVRALQEFRQTPSKETLARCIETWSWFTDDALLRNRIVLPWPLDSVLQDFREGVEGEALVIEAREGAFGDSSSWVGAERRWVKNGIGHDDLLAWNSGRYLSNDIARVGAPYPRRLTFGRRRTLRGDGVFREIVQIASAIDPPAKRLTILSTVFTAYRSGRVSAPLLRSALDLFFATANDKLAAEFAEFVVHSNPELWDDNRVAELASREAINGNIMVVEPGLAVTAFNRRQDLRGLIAVIAISTRHPGIAVEELREMHGDAFAVFSDDAPTVKAAVAVLRILCDKWDEDDIEELTTALTDAQNFRFLYEVAASGRRNRVYAQPKRAKLMLRLLQRRGSLASGRDMGLFDSLSSEVGAAPTGLVDASTCDELLLPCMHGFADVPAA